jgi:hypothetical protein
MVMELSNRKRMKAARLKKLIEFWVYHDDYDQGDEGDEGVALYMTLEGIHRHELKVNRTHLQVRKKHT